MAQQRRYLKKKQPSAEQLEDQQSVAGLESKAQGLNKALNSALGFMRGIADQSDLVKAVTAATTAQILQQASTTKDLAKQTATGLVSTKVEVKAAKDISKEAITTVNNKKVEVKTEKDLGKTLTANLATLKEQKKAARERSTFAKPTTAAAAKPTATPMPTPTVTPNITVEVPPVETPQANPSGLSKVWAGLAAAVSPVVNTFKKFDAALDNAVDRMIEKELEKEDAQERLRDQIQTSTTSNNTATQQTTNSSFFGKIVTSIQQWADKQAEKTAAEDRLRNQIQTNTSEVTNLTTELQNSTVTTTANNTSVDNLANQVQTNTAATAASTAIENTTQTNLANQVQTSTTQAATPTAPQPKFSTTAYGEEPSLAQNPQVATPPAAEATGPSLSEKALKQQMVDQLVAKGAITKEQAKDEKIVNSLLEVTSKYNDELKYTDYELQDQISNYTEIKSNLAGVSDSLKHHVRTLTTNNEQGDRYKTILSGALNIQKSLEKSAGDLSYNQSRLAEGELTSTEALEDKAKIDAKILAIEFERRLINKEIEDLQKNLTTQYSPAQKQLADEITAKEQERTQKLQEQAKVDTTSAEGRKKYQDIATKVAEITADLLVKQKELLGTSTSEQQSLIEQQNALREINYSLDGAKTAATDLGKAFDKDAKAASKIEQKLGLAGKLMKGLKKIPILGDVVDFSAAEKSMKGIASSGGSTMQVLQGGFKALGPSIKAAFGPLGIVMMVAEAIQGIVKAMFEADKQVTDIANQLGVSKDTASGIRDSFFETADQASALGVLRDHQLLTEKQIFEANNQINEALGTSIDYANQFGMEGRKSLAAFAAVSKYLRLSEDEQQKLAVQMQMTGQDAREIESSISKQVVLTKLQTGYQANFKKVMKDVLNTSNLVRTSFKGNMDALIKTTIEAQKMGTTLEKINSTANTFLDFESSIQSEMESEVLLGKDLNLDRLRGFALARDTAGVQKEMSRLISENGSAIEGNAIAYESLAKTLGLSTEEFADMYEKQKLSLKISQAQSNITEEVMERIQKSTGLQGKQFDDLKKQLTQGKLTGVEFYDILKKSGVSLNEVVQGLSEAQMAGLEAQSAQDKFNEALEKAKEIFVKFVDGGSLESLANGINDLVLFLTGKSKSDVSGKQVSSKVDTTYSKSAEYQEELQKQLKNSTNLAYYSQEQIKQEFDRAVLAFGEVPKNLESILPRDIGEKIESTVKNKVGAENYEKAVTAQLADVGWMKKAWTAITGGDVEYEIRKNLVNETLTQGRLPGSGEVQAGIAPQPTTTAPAAAAASTPGNKKVATAADGGVVQQSGLAQVDTGEVYLGKNTRETVRTIAQTNQASSKASEDTLAELKKLNSYMESQNKLLAAIGNKELVVEADKLAYTVAKATTRSYGNALNFNSYTT